MTTKQFYLIDTPRQPWTEHEKHQWQQKQTRSRCYKNDVFDALHQLKFDNNAYHICETITGASLATTTEVYPDSARTTPEECIRAQIVTIRRAIEFALSN